jgi:DNA-binding GntR family transcriptional regulator
MTAPRELSNGVDLPKIAYRKIKKLILNQDISAGQKLYHEDLTKRLKISQTPIREALHDW